jgi:hypothetical protein
VKEASNKRLILYDSIYLECPEGESVETESKLIVA